MPGKWANPLFEGGNAPVGAWNGLREMECKHFDNSVTSNDKKLSNRMTPKKKVSNRKPSRNLIWATSSQLIDEFHSILTKINFTKSTIY